MGDVWIAAESRLIALGALVAGAAALVYVQKEAATGATAHRQASEFSSSFNALPDLVSACC
jgi:hypothetical protein